MVMTISLTKSMAPGTAFRTRPSPAFTGSLTQKSLGGKGGFFTGTDLLSRFEHNPFTGPDDVPGEDVSVEDISELTAFQEFIDRHVKLSAIGDVQCMLIWAEWVRFHRRQTREFPRLLKEKEFKNLLVNLFDLTVMEDDYRGSIYSGIQFVS